jgi:hypothetical protein
MHARAVGGIRRKSCVANAPDVLDLLREVVPGGKIAWVDPRNGERWSDWATVCGLDLDGGVMLHFETDL